MSYEKDVFKRILNKVELDDIDMSVEDWAQSIGVMHNYGHGYVWELPVDRNGMINENKIIQLLEEYIEYEEELEGEM